MLQSSDPARGNQMRQTLQSHLQEPILWLQLPLQHQHFQQHQLFQSPVKGHLTRLVDHLRAQIKEAPAWGALAFGHYDDATKMQVTLDAVLDSGAGENPMLTMELSRRVICCFQRLFRLAQKHGDLAGRGIQSIHRRPQKVHMNADEWLMKHRMNWSEFGCGIVNWDTRQTLNLERVPGNPKAR